MDDAAIRGNQPELRNQFLRQRADVAPAKPATPPRPALHSKGSHALTRTLLPRKSNILRNLSLRT
jgi:hypothetical protein